MNSRSSGTYDAYPSLSGGIGADGFGLRQFESSLDKIVSGRQSVDRDGDSHGSYNSRFQFFASKRGGAIPEPSVSDIATREDSLVKAWRTVSEIDALLGSDFRPASMPPCDEDRPSVNDSYVKRLSTELEAALNVSLSFKERLRDSMRGSTGSGGSGGRQLLRQPSGPGSSHGIAAAAVATSNMPMAPTGGLGTSAAAAGLSGNGNGPSGLGPAAGGAGAAGGANAAAGTSAGQAAGAGAAGPGGGAAGTVQRRLSAGGAQAVQEACSTPEPVPAPGRSTHLHLHLRGHGELPSLPASPIVQPSPHFHANSHPEMQHLHARSHSHSSDPHSHSSPLPPRLSATTVVAAAASATITGPAASLSGHGAATFIARSSAPGGASGGGVSGASGLGGTERHPSTATSAVAAVTAALAGTTGAAAAAAPPPSPGAGPGGRGLGIALHHIPTPPASGPPPSPRTTQLAAAAAAAAAAASSITTNAAPAAAPPPHQQQAAAPPPVPAARRLGIAHVRVAIGSALDHGVWDSDGLWRPSEREVEVHVPPHLQRINPEDIVKVRELGRGCFGSVWLARWRGVEVALKELLDQGATDCAPGEVFSEAERLASLRHPCVIAFYGIVAAPGQYATVVEYLRMGSLKSGLSRLKKQGADISRRLRVAIALQAARGMEYLHAQFVVHFDLKCDNLLCDLRDPQRPVVKIGDLGLSKKKKNSFVSGNMRGTLPWMAPELFPGVRERQRQHQQQPTATGTAPAAHAAQAQKPAGGHGGGAAANGEAQGSPGGGGADGGSEVADDRVNEKVDVFSFGICLWEIWQLGEQPYSSIGLGDIFAGVMTGTLRPGVPPDCDPDWAEIMQACWHGTPRCRPSFSEIADRLDSLLTRFTALEGSGGSTGSGQGQGGGSGAGAAAQPAGSRRF